MIILILGPQGSGKGTQAKLLSEKFGFSYVSTGDVLREVAKTDKKINEMLKSGKYISDEVVLNLLKKFLDEKGSYDNLLLDGVPRRITQYEKLIKMLGRIDLAINLTISKKETVRRLSARRLDPKTGIIYNLVTSPRPPKGVNISSLVQRSDDKPDAIASRLREHEMETKPLIELLAKEGILVEVDGERPIDVIHRDLVKIIKARDKRW